MFTADRNFLGYVLARPDLGPDARAGRFLVRQHMEFTRSTQHLATIIVINALAFTAFARIGLGETGVVLWLPLNLLARHAGSEGDAAKEAAFHRDFAAQLQLRQDRKARLPLFRALRRAFDGHRLRLMANGSVEPHREATIPPLRTLWLAWNAARRAKR